MNALRSPPAGTAPPLGGRSRAQGARNPLQNSAQFGNRVSEAPKFIQR
jgi:hypothetical protein